ncbi:hypothetical protein CHS0354_014136 [Potamilus streckersoni]|uniref:Uncharacterized protein n=1 Tax=Potamilus streckersoni TaxID=2493646 RepID=A0AAE0TK03_9BIVA|nr:hypothetical protein CHS0354_014136 [Potamilus streckersoni]
MDTEGESTRRNSFGDKCDNVVKFVKKRQTQKRRLRKDEEMKEIYENFPSLSEKSRRAILTLVRGPAPNISTDDRETITL